MGFGFGILGIAGGIGTSVGPYAVGVLWDATSDFLWSFAARAIFPALGIIPMLILRMKNRGRRLTP